MITIWILRCREPARCIHFTIPSNFRLVVLDIALCSYLPPRVIFFINMWLCLMWQIVIFIAHGPDCNEMPGTNCSGNTAMNATGSPRNSLLEQIQQMQKDCLAATSIFTYTVGNEVDPGLSQQIACRFGGAYSRIEGVLFVF